MLTKNTTKILIIPVTKYGWTGQNRKTESRSGAEKYKASSLICFTSEWRKCRGRGWRIWGGGEGAAYKLFSRYPYDGVQNACLILYSAVEAVLFAD